MKTTRREFLKCLTASSAVVSLGAAVPRSLLSWPLGGARSPDPSATVLVVIQLGGGNDGLNSLVPYENDAYHGSRPTLRLGGDQVLQIRPGLGFHPQLQAFRDLLDEGSLTVLQDVGYAEPDRSHGGAREVWHTARPVDRLASLGWLGRALDEPFARWQGRTPALSIVTGAAPLALNAERVITPHIPSADHLRLRPAPGAKEHRLELEKLAAMARPEDGSPLLDRALRSTQQALAASRRIEEILNEASDPTGYPAWELAGQLSDIARILRADFGARVFYVEQGGPDPGGYDTHSRQATNHGALLQELAESVSAFVHDLKRDRLLDRVLVLIYSEFGRTLNENGRHGTDHGAAGPVFLAGGGVKGEIVGPLPDLDDLDGGGVRYRIDFRRVYATALESWLGLKSQAALGGAYEPLDVLRA